MSEVHLAADMVTRLQQSGAPYDERGFLFVLAGLEYLQSRLSERRHVTGPEVTHACRDLALEQYGLLAREVLEHWGIRETADFGRIVYALVDVGLLVTQPGDRIEDFQEVYSFERAFEESYVWGRALGA